MTVEEKYLGTSLDYYLKSIEPQFLKLKKFINFYKATKFIFWTLCISLIGILLILLIVEESVKFITIDEDIILIIMFIIAISYALMSLSEQKIRAESVELISNYIGGMKSIMWVDKYLFIDSVIRKERNIRSYVIGSIKTFVSYAFNVIEEDFSYNVYYVDVDEKRKRSSDDIKHFDGIVVLFKFLPEDIRQSVRSKKNKKIKFINNEMVYISSKINNNRFKLLTSTNINDIRVWAEKTIIEIVKMKEQIKKEIEFMKTDLKEEYFF